MLSFKKAYLWNLNQEASAAVKIPEGEPKIVKTRRWIRLYEYEHYPAQVLRTDSSRSTIQGPSAFVLCLGVVSHVESTVCNQKTGHAQERFLNREYLLDPKPSALRVSIAKRCIELIWNLRQIGFWLYYYSAQTINHGAHSNPSYSKPTPKQGPNKAYLRVSQSLFGPCFDWGGSIPQLPKYLQTEVLSEVFQKQQPRNERSSG